MRTRTPPAPPPTEVTIHTPPGFDLDALVAPLNSAAVDTSPEYRRRITRHSPLLFALLYFPHHLSSDETAGLISLSDFHVAFAASACRWTRRDLGPMEARDAWIAPRGGAKSTWGFLILPVWALAHGHRRFVAAFSDSGPQAGQHFRNLKHELDHNALLRTDYPELCEPMRRRGRSAGDTQINYVSAGGSAIMAKGVETSSLGAKHGNTRPDLLLFDDVEPHERRYSAESKAKRLGTIVDAVLAMNDQAVVQFLGTTTMYGSIMHDLVLAALGAEVAPWVTEQNIRPHYFPAIVTDDVDGSERSLWPQRWSLPYLQSIRGTRAYLMNMANTPPSSDSGYWTPEDITVLGPERWAACGITDRVLVVDPAVTSGRRSDYTGVAVVGSNPARQVAVVEYARGFRMSPAKIRDHVYGQLGRNRTIRRVRLEGNQGMDTWREILEPMPFGVELEIYRSADPKGVRFHQALDWYQRGWAVHAGDLPALTAQQLAYPNVANDDVLDAACAGLHHYLRHRPLT